MSHPSNFESNALDAIQWNNGPRQCSTSAFRLLFTAQSNILNAAYNLNGGRLGSWVPSSLQPIDRTGGNGWDRATLEGLRAFLQHYRAPASFVTAVTRDMALPTGAPLSADTVRALIWTETSYGDVVGTGAESYGAGSPANIYFASGSTTPRMGSRPPLPSNGVLDTNGFDCRSVTGPNSGTGAFAAVGRFIVSPLGVLTLIGAAATAMALSTDKARRQLGGARKNPVVSTGGKRNFISSRKWKKMTGKRRNPRRGSMTFGKIPSVVQLQNAIRQSGGWSMTLRGSDERAFEDAVNKAGMSYGEADRAMHTGAGMHRVLKALVNSGNEHAESLASSIVDVLGWEWV